jgi:hypothetical protein
MGFNWPRRNRLVPETNRNPCKPMAYPVPALPEEVLQIGAYLHAMRIHVWTRPTAACDLHPGALSTGAGE